MLYSRTLDSGAGLPPLILIHGLFGSLENLGGIARILSSHFTVYSVDLPNHGRSEHVQQCTLPKMVAMFINWMDANNLPSAGFLGHSLGGKVAMELALVNPERVTQLTVLDIAPVKYPSRHDRVFDGLLAIDPGTLRSRADADAILREYVPEMAVRTFLLKNLIKLDDAFTWRMNLDDLYQSYSDLIDANCDGRYLGKTLFIKGGDSDYIKEAYREAIVAKFPNARLKIIANTGHWLHAEKPELVAKIVLKAVLSPTELKMS